jgi:tetratricopeptide (TPR) repeat protein
MARAGAVLFVIVVSGACSTPGDAELNEGNRLAAIGKLDEAAQEYRAAAEKTKRARPRELLGMVLHASGKIDEARSAWLEAVALEPDAPDAQLGLARIESERGDHAAALDRLDRLVQRQPNRADARLERAVVLLRRNAQGDVERALTDSELALRAAPKDSDGAYVRATALVAAKRFDEASRLFDGLKPARPALAAWGKARIAAAESRNIDVIVFLREARQASDAGWVASRVREDPAFRYLWDDPEFSREF